MKINTKIIIFLTGSLLALFVAQIWINWGYSIEISTNPSASNLLVDGKPAKNNLRLKRGQHLIESSYSGYISQEQTINVPKDRKLFISLSKEPTFTYDIPPNELIFSQMVDGWLVGIDRKSENLIRLNNGQKELIYQGKTKFWSNSTSSYLVISKEENNIIIINKQTKAATRVSSPTGQRIESATINDSGLYYLSDSSPITRLSKIYRQANENAAVIGSTNATKLQGLSNNQLLLIAEADAELSTECTIVDVNMTTIQEVKANYCITNKSLNQVLFGGKDIQTYNTDTKGLTSIIPPVPSYSATYLDDQIILIYNTKDGLNITKYDPSTKSFTLSNLVSNAYYRRLIGVDNLKIIVQLKEGDIVSYTIDK